MSYFNSGSYISSTPYHTRYRNRLKIFLAIIVVAVIIFNIFLVKTVVGKIKANSEVRKNYNTAVDNYANLGMWYKADDSKMSWLRVYLAAFPVKEITSDIDEQYNIVVDKHFKNLVLEINKKDFLTNEEIIKYINGTFYLTFDKNSFAVFKSIMKKNESSIVLKNEGQVGFDTELTKLIRDYSRDDK